MSKKIMFSDAFGLTTAVLEGRKTMTRRTAYEGEVANPNWGIYTDSYNACRAHLYDGERLIAQSKYYIGEVVAIAQSAEAMPHQIRITDIKVERLQDISDKDCMKEGIVRCDDCLKEYKVKQPNLHNYYCTIDCDDCAKTPQKAFATLIDKVSSKGTWERNPWVFAYTFKLIK